MSRPSAFILAAVVAMLSSTTATAMPLFARRENVPCAACHSQVPRLNRTGYEYRRAGFRFPETLGKAEKPFNFGDFFTGRLQSNVTYTHSDDNGAKSDNFQFNFVEATLYPLTGSWGRWFSSLTELSVSSEDFFEIENAYVRGNYGKPEHFVHARFGVFHPFEGYGASDRPNGLTRPFIQRIPASFNQSTFFTPWNFDQVGLELGYTFKGFSASFSVLNGTFVRSDEGALKAFPAQGGALLKTATAPASNYKDFQLFLNQMIGERIGLSAYYYHGWIDLPYVLTEDPVKPNLWTNSFDRFAFYAWGQPLKHLALQGGIQLGIDHRFDAVANTTGDTFLSWGGFAEVLVPIFETLTGSVRYDFFDPASDKGRNELHGVTAAINWYHRTGLQLITEYGFRDTRQPGKDDKQDHSLQLRVIFIL